MRSLTLMVLIVTSIALIACAPSTAHPGELQTFATACDKPNEGQDIAVEGYLRLPDSFTGSQSIELRLYPDLSFTGKPIGVTMDFGDGPDEALRINSSYHDADLKVRLADGTEVPFGTRVRVSGTMYFPVVPQDFDCGLENVYVQRAK